MIKSILFVSVIISSVGCEQTFNLTPTSPSSSPITISNTNTNTNTATNNPDRTGSDTGPTDPNNPTPPGTVIPLPAYGEAVTREIAKNNPNLLATSCQTTHGESAWQWLDLVIRTLQVRDTRWGYLCKDENCTAFARDIVAYRASDGVKGIWIVDVIGNHCPLPNEVAEVRWGVLPFETERKWASHR